MKTLLCISLIPVIWPGAAAAGPRIVPGTYTTASGVMKVDYWQEDYAGGGPGQFGNVITAAGKGFRFSDAVLTSAACDFTKNPAPCTMNYTGGILSLDAGGPWLKGGRLKIDKISTTAKSKISRDGSLSFVMSMSRTFVLNGKKYALSSTVSWEGRPEARVEKSLKGQRGTGFASTIEINEVP